MRKVEAVAAPAAPRPDPSAVRHVAASVDRTEMDEAIRRRTAAGQTASEIAAALSITGSAVKEARNRLTGYVRPSMKAMKENVEERNEKIRSYKREGYSNERVAKLVGCTRGTVAQIWRYTEVKQPGLLYPSEPAKKSVAAEMAEASPEEWGKIRERVDREGRAKAEAFCGERHPRYNSVFCKHVGKCETRNHDWKWTE
jgi:DNA-binding CsgD family transcriptional regulator